MILWNFRDRLYRKLVFGLEWVEVYLLIKSKCIPNIYQYRPIKKPKYNEQKFIFLKEKTFETMSKGVAQFYLGYSLSLSLNKIK